MAELSEKMLDEILSLPSNLRAKLVDRLIKSLNLPIQKEIDELWSQEAEK
ncbi:MAG: addiction module protein [Promethearchaeia archaeon]